VKDSTGLKGAGDEDSIAAWWFRAGYTSTILTFVYCRCMGYRK